jgi:hypothetical protein
MMCMPQCLTGSGMPWDVPLSASAREREQAEEEDAFAMAASEAEEAAAEAAQFNPRPWLNLLTPRTAFRSREKPYVPPEQQPYLRPR